MKKPISIKIEIQAKDLTCAVECLNALQDDFEDVNIGNHALELEIESEDYRYRFKIKEE